MTLMTEKEARGKSILVLENWKSKRNDRGTELHWKRAAETNELNGWEQYQREWNFIETDYSERPSNNGLDIANPRFVFSTKLAKHLVWKDLTRSPTP